MLTLFCVSWCVPVALAGHTNGCVSYVLDDRSMVFTGDVSQRGTYNPTCSLSPERLELASCLGAALSRLRGLTSMTLQLRLRH